MIQMAASAAPDTTSKLNAEPKGLPGNPAIELVSKLDALPFPQVFPDGRGVIGSTCE